MPRIFDNIALDLLPALRQTLEVANRSDFCVGYFNLRGWKSIDDLSEQWAGGESNQCRLLVGMQRLPKEELRKAYSLLPQQEQVSNQTVIRLKRALAKEFQEQLTFGAPTDEDEAGLGRLAPQLRPLAEFATESSSSPLFIHRIVRYFVKALNFIPLFIDARGKRGKSEDYKQFGFAAEEQDQIAALLNSTLFYWFWRSHCDGFHCGYNDVYAIPYRPLADASDRQALKQLVSKLIQHLQERSEERAITTQAGLIRYQEFYPAAAKPIIDEIDASMARHYQFTGEELDFIINYDIKYRLGRDGESEEE